MIFHEIYGRYFHIAKKIMELPEITEKAINNIITNEGFRDSILFVPKKIIPQKDNSDWGIFRRNEKGDIIPIIKNKPVSIITLAQKMWLKAKLSEPQTPLFMDTKTIEALNEKLSDVPPLYKKDFFRYIDTFTDGDDFSDKSYQRYFRIILSAIKSHKVLDISFNDARNTPRRILCLPFKIEYSKKNEKFRLHCYHIKHDAILQTRIINLGRITSVSETDKSGDNIPKSNFFKREMQKQCEPVIIKVFNERNAPERFFMEFAPYRKYSERDLESGNCMVKLWYDKKDETELLIRLLSFGPVIEVIGPDSFRNQVKMRVLKQWEIIDL